MREQWSRKDNRVETFTVAASDSGPTDVQLQCTGFEPLLIYNNGADLSVGYNRGGPFITLPDAYQYTFEYKHPFGSEIYLVCPAGSTEITFMIGGQLYDR